ncbi:MAG: hypothetical protein WCR49_00325, partial [Opitutae bacterium]
PLLRLVAVAATAAAWAAWTTKTPSSRPAGLRRGKSAEHFKARSSGRAFFWPALFPAVTHLKSPTTQLMAE